MSEHGLAYLLQGIETFAAINGRVVRDTLVEGGSVVEYDMRSPKGPVEVHGQSFREYPIVLTYDARLSDDALRLELARQLIRLAPVHWPLFGRKLGNASERGMELESLACTVAQNGGRAHLDAFLRQYLPRG